MKIYAVKDINYIFAYLFINDRKDNCYLELIEDLPYYPLFLDLFIKKNKKIINNYYTMKWINERVIPYERQNIIDILKDNNLKYYNEISMFIMAGGRSSMDNTYLAEIKYQDIDDKIKNRRNKLIKDFINLKENLIVFFEDGKTKLCKHQIKNNKPFLNELANEIIFDNVTRYDYLELYENGIDFPLTYYELIEYINQNIYSTNDIKEEFDFTRQYVYKLKEKNKILSLNNNLFIKNDILTYNNK